MTREEAIENLKWLLECSYVDDFKDEENEALDMAIKALEQEHSRDMEEIREVMSCDVDAETKCKMISNILTAKPHYFEKQEPKTLDKIRAEIIKLRSRQNVGVLECLDIIDKYIAESEDKE